MTINLDGSPALRNKLHTNSSPRPIKSIPAESTAVLADIYTARPSPGTPGRLYLPEDRPFTLYDNGSSWVRYQDGRLYDVPNTGWNLSSNAGDASFALSEGSLKLTGRTDYLDEPILLSRNAPERESYSVTLKWSGSLIAAQGAKDNRTGVGYFGFQDSKSGKFVALAFMGFSQNQRFFIEKWDAPNKPVDQYIENTNISLDMMRWVKLSNDGVNISFAVSSNGVDFADLFQVAKADFLHSPDKLFVGVYNQKTQLSIDSWK
jgi:hypothetical protein